MYMYVHVHVRVHAHDVYMPQLYPCDSHMTLVPYLSQTEAELSGPLTTHQSAGSAGDPTGNSSHDHMCKGLTRGVLPVLWS